MIPPFARLRVSRNSAAVQTGGVVASTGDVIQLSADPSGISGVSQYKWEIFDYPPGYAQPSGWATDSSGVYYATGAVPPTFTLGDSAHWGKYMLRLTVNGGVSYNTAVIPNAQLVDESTDLTVLSPSGLRDLGAREGVQFGGQILGWAGDHKKNLRVIETFIAGGGGGGSSFPLTTDVSAAGHKITNLGTPTASGDAVNKSYVDALSPNDRGLAVVVYTSNVASLTGAPAGTDGATPNVGDTVLLAGQSTPSQNGLWITASGSWTRPANFATGSHVASARVFIQKGTVYGDTGWICTSDAPTDVVDTDSLTFRQFTASSADEITLHLAGNVLSIKGNGVSNTEIRQGAATSVIGRSANSLGNVADIVASANGQVLKRAAGALAFALIDLTTDVGALGSAAQHARVNAGATALEYANIDLAPVACATTGNITLSGEQTIDGVTTSGSRVLVWKQTTASQNGIYVSGAGAWTRAADQDTSLDFRPGITFVIDGGTTQAGRIALLRTAGAVTVGSTSLTYTLSFAAPVSGTDDNKVAIASGGGFTYAFLTNANVDPAAGIALSKLAFGAADEVLTTNTGATALQSRKIVDANVASGAAIAGTKISPNFGSQLVQTTGGFSTSGASTLSGAINFGSASPRAAAGEMRAGYGLTLMSALTVGGVNDAKIIQFLQVAGTPNVDDTLVIGDQTRTAQTLVDAATNVNLRVAGSAKLSCTSASVLLTTDSVIIGASGPTTVRAPQLNQAGRAFRVNFRAGDNSAASGLGGHMSVSPGTASGATLGTVAFGDLYLTGGIVNGTIEGNLSLHAENTSWNGLTRGFYLGKVLTAATGNPANGLYGWSGANGEWVTRAVSGDQKVGDGSLPYILNAGTSADFQIAATSKIKIDATGLGFYAHATAAQSADMVALTDSTTGTPSTTIGDVGGSFNQATLNNIHASLLTQINKVRTALRATGYMA